DGIRDSSVTGVQTCALPICLLAAVLIGMAALAVDIGFAIYKHRQMQSAADAAAFGAATALATGHPADFRTEAYALAAAVGYVNEIGRASCREAVWTREREMV